MTRIEISGEAFMIDGSPTYAGRTCEGRSVEGLLFNVRAVQATFDDANPQTRPLWAYPDTDKWDPERNLSEFLSALPEWRAHGVLGFTVNFQGGGGRYTPEVYQAYDNNGFAPGGSLKEEYAGRMARIIERTDDLGMVPIVSMFYWVHANKMRGEEAIWRAVENGLSFLQSTGRANFLVEIANENFHNFTHPILHPERVHEMIRHFKERYPQFLFSTSLVGANPETRHGVPGTELIAACDYILIHGNGARPAALQAVFDQVRSDPAFLAHPKPVMINEDSTGLPNLEAAWHKYVSWGYYDQGYNGEARQHDIWVEDPAFHLRECRVERLSGFQTPPVNWRINTPRKRAFFERVAEITGANAATA